MKRIAVIDRELCKPNKCGMPCIVKCPLNKTGEKTIFYDEENKMIIIDENTCIGCGICVKSCPFNAITIVNLPYEPDEKPVHRFGINGFVLYRLPYPIVGQVVGILGPNGIGKTSALRILNGEVKPNFGEVGKEYDVKELVKIFRGTELQNYLESLSEKKIKIAYKPQRVDLLPKYFGDKKVSEVLLKVDERGVVDELLKIFDMISIKDKNIATLSGGELQILSVVATIAKNADFYYFDEPTSFLDVFQRLRLANVIRDYCKDRAVLIVDHDLAFMDVVADRVHIFYGQPAVYGIVSNPYSARVGINSFLDGYIKEANVRFRVEKIVFDRFIPIEPSKETLVSFTEITKKLDGFRLKVSPGEIKKKEVLVVFGANALGKSTFAKILAGELKQDSGEISSNVEISYKPQMIKIDFDGTLEELFIQNDISVHSSSFKNEILRPLNLERLLPKNVKKFSGGEIQRVAIALTLTKKADLYILDEPSAFLDVEERLNLAKSLRRFIENNEVSMLVIDHDLLMLSQIGSRAMVFFGKPGVEGHASMFSLKDGINEFLRQVGVTFRFDKDTKRPRANKPGSALDREQKSKGIYFYV
ncbi:MAG: ribosome biogenesis/translation initiation ATPase RLI [Candidatus Aenigmarchaeota archaeon]|nr:ribosome biogenesis/translation initiation ATPase RLI [Candidatus Aenigmarchaeota archaeon]